MGEVWVVHRGALGDGVLIWPLLRAIARGGGRAVIASEWARAKLAERRTGARAVDLDSREMLELWSDEGSVGVERGIDRVISFLGGEAWRERAHAKFPGARIEMIERRADRVLAMELSERECGAVAMAAARENPAGAIVLHVGAGEEWRRWALERWVELAGLVRAGGGRVRLIAGEAERERFSPGERELFMQGGGEMIATLEELAAMIEGARLVVGNDSGAAHLAAGVGVATLVLFGPSDPARWAPIGPAVRVISPGEAREMSWLGVDRVRQEIEACLSGGGALWAR